MTQLKKIFFSLLLILPSCILYPYEHYDGECYELYNDYPVDCWVDRRGDECCEWQTSRYCYEVWCSELDYHGYNECRWDFKRRYCY